MMDYEDMVLMRADGFDDCIIGVCTGFGREPCIAYDKSKVLSKLMVRDGMGADEAHEFFDFNIEGAYVGENTPVYVDTDWVIP